MTVERTFCDHQRLAPLCTARRSPHLARQSFQRPDRHILRFIGPSLTEPQRVLVRDLAMMQVLSEDLQQRYMETGLMSQEDQTQIRACPPISNRTSSGLAFSV